MKIINIDTTNSTNTFLKELLKTSELQDFTVIRTDKQTSGRGQMGSKWVSEHFKNLTFSVLCKFDCLDVSKQRYLSFIVSLAVYSLLERLDLPKLAIKWPNDILSSRHKICGILIENVLQQQRIVSSVVGVGLNVNQLKFPSEVGKVTSVKLINGKDINLDDLLCQFIDVLMSYVRRLKNKEFSSLEQEYLSVLYMKDKPQMFKSSGRVFLGMIRGVSENGSLQIELEDASIEEFAVKQVSFL